MKSEVLKRMIPIANLIDLVRIEIEPEVIEGRNNKGEVESLTFKRFRLAITELDYEEIILKSDFYTKVHIDHPIEQRREYAMRSIKRQIKELLSAESTNHLEQEINIAISIKKHIRNELEKLEKPNQIPFKFEKPPLKYDNMFVGDNKRIADKMVEHLLSPNSDEKNKAKWLALWDVFKEKEMILMKVKKRFFEEIFPDKFNGVALGVDVWKGKGRRSKGTANTNYTSSKEELLDIYLDEFKKP